MADGTNENGINNPIRYAGYQWDKEEGLYYLNARYYDPKIARFLSEDTYRGDPNDPLSLNLYSYVSNNPIRYYDPTGHILTEWDKSHLSVAQQNDIQVYTYNWEKANASGNAGDKAKYHDLAEGIRNTARAWNEVGSDSGYTYRIVPSSGSSSSSGSGSSPSSGGAKSTTGVGDNSNGQYSLIFADIGDYFNNYVGTHNITSNDIKDVFGVEDNQIAYLRFDSNVDKGVSGLSIDIEKIEKDAVIDIRERLDRILNKGHQFLFFDTTWSYYDTSFTKSYTDNCNRAVSDYGGWLALGFGAEWAKNSLEYLQVAALIPEAYVNPYATVGGSIALGFYQTLADPQPGINNYFAEHDLLGFGKKALNATVEKITLDNSEYKYFLQGENNSYRKGFINELSTLKGDINKQDIIYGNDNDKKVYKQTMIDYIDNIVKINTNYKESKKNMENMLKREVDNCKSTLDELLSGLKV